MIIFDTHILIWFLQGDPKLREQARSVIYEEVRTGDVLVPVIVFWEVALLTARGKVRLSMDVLPWCRRVLHLPGFMLGPLEPEIAIGSVGLAWNHKDPADRILVATAQHWQAPILTADQEIIDYATAGHVEAVDARR